MGFVFHGGWGGLLGVVGMLQGSFMEVCRGLKGLSGGLKGYFFVRGGRSGIKGFGCLGFVGLVGFMEA